MLDSYKDLVLQQVEDLILEKDIDFVLFVEDKEDEMFWGNILKHQKFKLNPKINAYGISKNNNETTGKHIILKYHQICAEYPKMMEKIKIAVDSDYDYLLDKGNFNIKNHILQTYTYSIENYFCCAPSLESLCLKSTQSKNKKVFDFKKFLTKYSEIIYPLFIVSLLYEQNKTQFDEQTIYSITNFCKDVFIDFKLVKFEEIMSSLKHLKPKVQNQLNLLKTNFSDQDYEQMKIKIEAKGVQSENCYLFIKGHFLLEQLLAPIVKNITNDLSKEAGAKLNDTAEKQSYFNSLKKANDLLHENFNFYTCDLFKKVERDILQINIP